MSETVSAIVLEATVGPEFHILKKANAQDVPVAAVSMYPDRFELMEGEALAPASPEEAPETPDETADPDAKETEPAKGRGRKSK